MWNVGTINLLPPKKKAPRPSQGLILIVLALILTIAIVVQWVLASKWKTEAEVFDKVTKQTEIQIKDLKENGELIAKRNAYADAKMFIEKNEKSRIDWAPYISAVVEPLQKQDIIKLLTADEFNKLTIDFEFQKLESLIEYIEQLEQDNRLKEVKLDTTYLSKNNEDAENADQSNGEKEKDIYKLKLAIHLEKAGGQPS
ncbi:hypothetical protein [Paenibacillus sp. L3-i20]|uniref:hypothetical protein n=1 Tax=Paenibacillus sp. L3-i20 TaxID=2905833 RepID=UPI001EDD82FB|nr:hypothetical protein [Paenibacillus sp. L3-i20]GKU79896.1 hypothetical protein L3i20_v242930 [Paenibacillus sp. L3-i20]